MKQHNRCRTSKRGLAKDFARVHQAGIECADRQHSRAEHAMLRVQQHDPEVLDRARAVLRHEVGGDILWAVELDAVTGRPRERTPAQLYGR